MTVGVDENIAPVQPLSPPQSPPLKKERKSFVLSPPVLSPRFEVLKEVLVYDKETVDELVSHLIHLVNKYENEALYWSTLYEESQKELFEMKDKQRTEQKEEADYLDPEVIPVGPRRSSKQSLEGPGADGANDGSSPNRSASNRWGLSLRGVLNAVVGNQYASVSSESGSPTNADPN